MYAVVANARCLLSIFCIMPSVRVPWTMEEQDAVLRYCNTVKTSADEESLRGLYNFFYRSVGQAELEERQCV